LALGDGFDRGVDGVDLVVARPLAAAVVVVVLEDHLLCLGCQALPGSVSRPERGRRRKLIEPEGGLPLLAGAGSIVEHEAIAVGREDEWDLKRLGILQGLLHARADAVAVLLGLDQGDRNVRLIVENVVGSLGLAPRDELASDDDPTAGECDLLANLQHLIPARMA
jgi:hypothetical protein